MYINFRNFFFRNKGLIVKVNNHILEPGMRVGATQSPMQEQPWG